jgi:hypothetical protein
MFLSILLFATTIHAQTYSVTQITNNTINDQFVSINTMGDLMWIVDTIYPSSDLYKYDAATQTTTLFHSGDFINVWFLLDNGDVFWEEFDGSDGEIFMYDVASGQVTALTNNRNDDVALQVNESGDAVWFQHYLDINNGWTDDVYVRYASDGVIRRLTHSDIDINDQGNRPRINAGGEVVWQGAVDRHVYHYDPATQSVTDLVAGSADEHWKPEIADNGDIVWSKLNVADPNAPLDQILHRDAVSGTVTMLEGYKFDINNNGDVLYVAREAGTLNRGVFHFDSATGSITQVMPYHSDVRYEVKINDRGDMAWSRGNFQYNDATLFLRDAATQTVNQLATILVLDTVEEGWDLAENGDLFWVLFDTDDEIYVYDSQTATTTMLTDNTLNDDWPAINAKGDVAWEQWDGDAEIFVATKNQTMVMPLDVRQLRIRKSTVDLKAKFDYSGLPAKTDVIQIRIDGVTLASVPFADFRHHRAVYEYKARGVEIEINFSRGKLEVELKRVDLSGIDLSDGADVQIAFGATIGSDHVSLKEIKHDGPPHQSR